MRLSGSEAACGEQEPEWAFLLWAQLLVNAQASAWAKRRSPTPSSFVIGRSCSSPTHPYPITGFLSCLSSPLPWKINTFRSGSTADRSTDALAKRSLFPYQQNQSIAAELRAWVCTYRHYGDRMPAQHWVYKLPTNACTLKACTDFSRKPHPQTHSRLKF